MKMWEAIIKLLDSPEEDIQVNALWIMGTAVQNNPKAQEAVSHLPVVKLPFNNFI
jgi:hsp70-interacting protein